jgi:hypothetical protein
VIVSWNGLVGFGVGRVLFVDLQMSDDNSSSSAGPNNNPANFPKAVVEYAENFDTNVVALDKEIQEKGGLEIQNPCKAIICFKQLRIL